MPKISVITPSIRPQYLNITQECLEKQTFTDFEWHVEIGLRNQHTLSRDLNSMLRRSKGEIVVFLQDCIRIEDNALEMIAAGYDKTFTTYPVGKIIKETDSPRWDWRTSPLLEKIDPHMWEADFASAPLEALQNLGGFDEEFDKGWSWDNVELAWRAHYAGYQFKNNPDIRGVAIDHDAIIPNPYRNKLPNNDTRANETKARAEIGKWKLAYL